MSQPQRATFGGLHAGGSLRHLVSKYPSMTPVCKELVQNGIDMTAKSIMLSVDLDEGTIVYQDDGLGATVEDFERATGTIGMSIKSADKYGRFGIGLVAPLSICERFTFTSARKGDMYREWLFDRSALFAAERAFPFPQRVHQQLVHNDGKTPTKGRDRVWWRTQVDMTGLTADKAKRRLVIDDLAYEIQSEFSAHMLKLGTTVKLRLTENGSTLEKVVRGKEFEGKELPVWERECDGVGRVVMRMFVAPRGYVGKLRISVGCADNPSRVNMQTFVSSDVFRTLGEKVKEVLRSGMFQGEIIGEKLEMNANRKAFVISDASVGLAIALEEWFQQVGSSYYHDERSKRRDEHLQGLANQVLDKVRYMFADGSPYAKVITKALFGSVGKGHAAFPRTEVGGGAGMTGLTATSGVSKGEGEKGGVGREAREESGGHKPGHMPRVAIGAEGGERRVVKGHSAGPHIGFGKFDSSRLWRFNAEALHLSINATHPTLVSVEKSEYKTKALIEFILMTALQIECADDEWRAYAEIFSETLVDNYVQMLLLQGTVSRS